MASIEKTCEYHCLPTIYKAFWPTRERENNLPQCESANIKTPRIQILAKTRKKGLYSIQKEVKLVDLTVIHYKLMQNLIKTFKLDAAREKPLNMTLVVKKTLI